MGQEARANAARRRAIEAAAREQRLQRFAEVIVHFKPLDRQGKAKRVRAFRQAGYSVQGGDRHPVLVVQDGGSDSVFLFHWADVDHVELVPSRVAEAAVVHPGASE